MIPFFVVDRPISLEILKGFWSTQPGVRYGLMASACTTPRFRQLFSEYPGCTTDCPCRSSNEIDTASFAAACPNRQSVIKMGDSGIFEGGGRLSYEQLFDRYQAMNVDYGIMVDYFLDAPKTVRSATEAVKVYEQQRRAFSLVLVAQGNSVDEYVNCYKRLREFGEFPIAVGGMLRTRANSARFLHVPQSEFLEQVLQAIRQQFDPSWLFVLGVYHPNRHAKLESLGVTGADYKGWIFNYTHRRDLISRALAPVSTTPAAASSPRLLQLLDRRDSLLSQLKRRNAALRGNLEKDQSKLAKRRKNGTLGLIGRLDDQLHLLIENQSRQNGLSPAEAPLWKNALAVLRTTDQEIRFSGVHNYLESRVLPHLTREANEENTKE